MSFSTFVSEIPQILVVFMNASPEALLALVSLVAFATIGFCVHRTTKIHTKKDDS